MVDLEDESLSLQEEPFSREENDKLFIFHTHLDREGYKIYLEAVKEREQAM